MDTILSVVAGNFLTIAIILILLGGITFYNNDDTVWFETFLIGTIVGCASLAGIDISILTIGMYIVGSLIVAVIQCIWIDTRKISEWAAFSHCSSHKWMDFKNKEGERELSVNYTKLSKAMAKYAIAAPFVVISWCFGEFIVSICREISQYVGKFAIARVERLLKK